jgi:hypothetical protein
MPGVARRAISVWTAIMEMWWATTSCSSRAIRARSPRVACSSRVASMACRDAARTAVRLRALRAAVPATATATASWATRPPPVGRWPVARVRRVAAVMVAAAAGRWRRAAASGTVDPTASSSTAGRSAEEPSPSAATSATASSPRSAPPAGGQRSRTALAWLTAPLSRQPGRLASPLAGHFGVPRGRDRPGRRVPVAEEVRTAPWRDDAAVSAS